MYDEIMINISVDLAYLQTSEMRIVILSTLRPSDSSSDRETGHYMMYFQLSDTQIVTFGWTVM